MHSPSVGAVKKNDRSGCNRVCKFLKIDRGWVVSCSATDNYLRKRTDI
jgi:hypothetical protein